MLCHFPGRGYESHFLNLSDRKAPPLFVFQEVSHMTSITHDRPGDTDRSVCMGAVISSNLDFFDYYESCTEGGGGG